MRKIISKIAGLMLGLSLALGVGIVAANSRKASETRATDFTISSASSVTQDGITVSFDKGSGSNAPAWYSAGLRLYGSNTVTVTSSNNITSVVFNWEKQGNKAFATVTADVGSYTHPSAAGDGTWTGSATTIVFTLGSSGQLQLNTMSAIASGGGGGETTNYTVSFDMQSHGSQVSSQSIASGGKVTEPTAPTADGYTFGGWYKEAACSTAWNFSTDTVSAATILYAKWTQNPSGGTVYTKVDSEPADWSGDYLLVYENSSTAYVWTGVDATSCYATATISDDSISKPEAASTISIASVSGGYSIQVNGGTNDGKYISGASGSNTFNFGSSASANTISYDSGVEIVSNTSHLRFNSASDQMRFRYFKSASYSSQKVVSLYKEGQTIDPSLDTLTIKANGSEADSATMNYSVGSTLFYAYDESDNLVSGCEWTISDSTIATLEMNGNNVPYVTFLKGGTVTITASKSGYNMGSFSLTINVGTLQSVVVSGSMSKTAYCVGESWSPAGLVATASYSYGYSYDASSDVTWTYNPASPVVGVTSVVATATLGGVPGNSSAQNVTVSRTNPIQVLYTQSAGASVDVYGYYVGFLDGTGPVIMDGAYGIVIFNKTADVSGYTANETILHVTGSISIYKGLYEIGSATMSVASGSYDAPETPVVYSTNGSETADYASRLTTVTGTPTLTSGSFDDAAGTADIKMSFAVGVKTVQVFYKKAAQTADADAFAAIKASVAGGSEITIKGFTGWYDGFQVQMNGYVPAVETYTAEDFAQDLLDQTDAVCEDYNGTDNNHDAIEAIWSNLASNDKYPSLPSAQKTILSEAERNESGTVVERAMARYDYLTGKYNLSNFINGRTPVVFAESNHVVPVLANTTSSTIVIVVVALTSITSIGVLLVIKRKRSLVK